MAGPSQAELAKSLAMAQQELDYRVDLFNRWLHAMLYGGLYGGLNVASHLIGNIAMQDDFFML